MLDETAETGASSIGSGSELNGPSRGCAGETGRLPGIVSSLGGCAYGGGEMGSVGSALNSTSQVSKPSSCLMGSDASSGVGAMTSFVKDSPRIGTRRDLEVVGRKKLVIEFRTLAIGLVVTVEKVGDSGIERG